MSDINEDQEKRTETIQIDFLELVWREMKVKVSPREVELIKEAVENGDIQDSDGFYNFVDDLFQDESGADFDVNEHNIDTSMQFIPENHGEQEPTMEVFENGTEIWNNYDNKQK